MRREIDPLSRNRSTNPESRNHLATAVLGDGIVDANYQYRVEGVAAAKLNALVLCDGCNLRRTPHEMSGQRRCRICRDRGK